MEADVSSLDLNGLPCRNDVFHRADGKLHVVAVRVPQNDLRIDVVERRLDVQLAVVCIADRICKPCVFDDRISEILIAPSAEHLIHHLVRKRERNGMVGCALVAAELIDRRAVFPDPVQLLHVSELRDVGVGDVLHGDAVVRNEQHVLTAVDDGRFRRHAGIAVPGAVFLQEQKPVRLLQVKLEHALDRLNSVDIQMVAVVAMTVVVEADPLRSDAVRCEVNEVFAREHVQGLLAEARFGIIRKLLCTVLRTPGHFLHPIGRLVAALKCDLHVCVIARAGPRNLRARDRVRRVLAADLIDNAYKALAVIPERVVGPHQVPCLFLAVVLIVAAELVIFVAVIIRRVNSDFVHQLGSAEFTPHRLRAVLRGADSSLVGNAAGVRGESVFRFLFRIGALHRDRRVIDADRAARVRLKGKTERSVALEVLRAHGNSDRERRNAEREDEGLIDLGIVPAHDRIAFAGGLYGAADDGIDRAGTLDRDHDAFLAGRMDVFDLTEGKHALLGFFVVEDRDRARACRAVRGRAARRAEHQVEHPVAVAPIVVQRNDLDILGGFARRKGDLDVCADNGVGQDVCDLLQILEQIRARGQPLRNRVLAGKQVRRPLHGVESVVRFADRHGFGSVGDDHVGIGLDRRFLCGFLRIFAVQVLYRFGIGILIVVLFAKTALFLQELQRFIDTLLICFQRLGIVHDLLDRRFVILERHLAVFGIFHHLRQGHVVIRVYDLLLGAANTDDIVLAVFRRHVGDPDKRCGFAFRVSAASDAQQIDRFGVFFDLRRRSGQIEDVVHKDVFPELDLGDENILPLVLHGIRDRSHRQNADQHQKRDRRA